ncbi:MAG: ribosomal-processing cysteine protease Prp [Bacilli bacterium]|nr:ribosomal-processing cysteine protease Prp [Bacilli bacterium]
MIKVTYETDKGQFTSLEVKGHAQSAEPGKDLVCSAVSAVTIGGLNALANPSKTLVIEVSEGYVLITKKGAIVKEDEIVIKTILTQLETIARDYPKYVKISRKEK